MLRQVGQLDAIIVPISGGGMCSGVATVAKALRPGIRVIAAEPHGAALLIKPAVRCLSITWVVMPGLGLCRVWAGQAGMRAVTNTDFCSSPVRDGTACGRPSHAPVKLHCEWLGFLCSCLIRSRMCYGRSTQQSVS